MGLHFWLIPLIAILAAGVGIFYLAVRRDGYSGVREDGRTCWDDPVEKPKVQAEWNYYGKR